MSLAIGMLFIDNIVGLAVGIVMGLIGHVFNYFKSWKYSMHLKMWYCIGCDIGFVLVGEQTKHSNSKYIASLAFGYTCYRVWGEDRPTKEIGWFWWLFSLYSLVQ